MARQETTGGAFPAGQDQQTITGGRVAPRHSSGVWGVRRSFQKGPYTSLQFLRTIL